MTIYRSEPGVLAGPTFDQLQTSNPSGVRRRLSSAELTQADVVRIALIALVAVILLVVLIAGRLR